MSTLVAGFDLETTGLSQPDGHRIIEAAVIFHELETGVERGRFVRRFNPERPIDAKAQAVHGISFDDLVACPTWATLGPQIGALLSRAQVIVAHNGLGFDMPFVNGELARVGAPVVKSPLIDTMIDGRWATPMGKYPNLGELAFACNVPYDPAAAHAADYDVVTMMKAFFFARAKGFFTQPTSAV